MGNESERILWYADLYYTKTYNCIAVISEYKLSSHIHSR